MVEIKQFMGPTMITYEEGRILYDLVSKYQPNNILSSIVLAGYAELFLAKSLFKINQLFILDGVEDSTDRADHDPKFNFSKNDVKNVNLIKTASPSEWVKRNAYSYDFVYLDLMHKNLSEVVDNVYKLTDKKNIIVVHDIYCEPSEEMQIPIQWQELREKYNKDNNISFEEIKTRNNVGQLNGLGVVVIEKIKINDEDLTIETQEKINDLVKQIEDTVGKLNPAEELAVSAIINEDVKEEVVVKDNIVDETVVKNEAAISPVTDESEKIDTEVTAAKKRGRPFGTGKK